MAAIEDSLPLVHRCPGPPPAGSPQLQLALSADDRTRLRGLRQSRCGQPLLLQLERGEPLRPGEWLRSERAGSAWVQVEAAAEPLLIVRASSTLALLQAAYHLGNRHVAMEIHADELRMLQDPVLAGLLRQRGLMLTELEAPFHPERGAYGAHSHDPIHSHGH
ncbi:MAG: urease accessory protein UreE [Synechococcus sp. ELA057]